MWSKDKISPPSTLSQQSTIPLSAPPSEIHEKIADHNTAKNKPNSTITSAKFGGTSAQTHECTSISYTALHTNTSNCTAIQVNMMSSAPALEKDTVKNLNSQFDNRDHDVQKKKPMDIASTSVLTDMYVPVSDEPNPIIGFDANGHLVTRQAAPHTNPRDPRLNRGEPISPKLLMVTKVDEMAEAPQDDTTIERRDMSTNTDRVTLSEAHTQTDLSLHQYETKLHELDKYNSEMRRLLHSLLEMIDSGINHDE